MSGPCDGLCHAQAWFTAPEPPFPEDTDAHLEFRSKTEKTPRGTGEERNPPSCCPDKTQPTRPVSSETIAGQRSTATLETQPCAAFSQIDTSYLLNGFEIVF